MLFSPQICSYRMTRPCIICEFLCQTVSYISVFFSKLVTSVGGLQMANTEPYRPISSLAAGLIIIISIMIVIRNMTIFHGLIIS